MLFISHFVQSCSTRISLRRGRALPLLGFGTGRPGGSREPEAIGWGTFQGSWRHAATNHPLAPPHANEPFYLHVYAYALAGHMIQNNANMYNMTSTMTSQLCLYYQPILSTRTNHQVELGFISLHLGLRYPIRVYDMYAKNVAANMWACPVALPMNGWQQSFCAAGACSIL